jgi:hypothetical protein
LAKSNKSRFPRYDLAGDHAAGIAHVDDVSFGLAVTVDSVGLDHTIAALLGKDEAIGAGTACQVVVTCTAADLEREVGARLSRSVDRVVAAERVEEG